MMEYRAFTGQLTFHGGGGGCRNDDGLCCGGGMSCLAVAGHCRYILLFALSSSAGGWTGISISSCFLLCVRCTNSCGRMRLRIGHSRWGRRNDVVNRRGAGCLCLGGRTVH